MLQMLEDRRAVAKAVSTWQRKFATGSERFSALGGTIYWHEPLGTWGLFLEYEREAGRHNYWNVFGREPFEFRRRIIVEVNPPLSGTYTNVVGLVARDDDGSRWMLHRGRLNPKRVKINGEQFAHVTRLKPEPVLLSDGQASRYSYYRVANLDEDTASVQTQTANFVRECARIRGIYLAAASGRKVVSGEISSNSNRETAGSYTIPAHGARSAHKRHADVWKVLSALLDQWKIEWSTTKVDGFGPDLRTDAHLFEIKADADSSSIQHGIGQLVFYEALLKKRFTRVLVLPDPATHLEPAFKKLAIKVLPYSYKWKNPEFDKGVLRSLIFNSARP